MDDLAAEHIDPIERQREEFQPPLLYIYSHRPAEMAPVPKGDRTMASSPHSPCDFVFDRVSAALRRQFSVREGKQMRMSRKVQQSFRNGFGGLQGFDLLKLHATVAGGIAEFYGDWP